MQEKQCFCSKCGKETEYLLQKKFVVRNVKDKEYIFSITVAICPECKGELDVKEVTRRNEREIDEQYRKTEDLVLLEDIEKLMTIYRIGKEPLALALGFGEVTIARYFEGQMPARDYSEMIKMALSNPSFMKKNLVNNEEKMTRTAYRKAMSAYKKIEEQFDLSKELLGSVAAFFKKLGPVSESTLHSLLYFTQGVSLAVNGFPIFEEDCVAGANGPLYLEVQRLLKDMTYNPYDDPRYAIILGKEEELMPEEKEAIDLVADHYGIYGGKILRNLACSESPWIETRRGYGDGLPCDKEIPKELIKGYFEGVREKHAGKPGEWVVAYLREKVKNKIR